MTAGPLVAETLQTWREAERLLEALPPESPYRESARLLVHELRSEYLELTSEQSASETRMRASRAAIDRAVATLAKIAPKGLLPPERDIDAPSGSEPAPGGAG